MSVSDALPTPEMQIDVVDVTDHPIGIAERSSVLPDQDNFRVVHVLLLNSNGELLLQQLAATRERNPLRWGASVAAYLFAGESYEAAAHRRLRQELGVADVAVSCVGKTSMLDQGSIKFIELYEAQYDGPLSIDHTHIADVAFVPVDAVAARLKSDPTGFTPTFRILFPFFLAARSRQ